MLITLWFHVNIYMDAGDYVIGCDVDVTVVM